MKMSRVVLVLGFVLIMGLYSDAQPEVIKDIAEPTECCFKFFTGKIPPEKILKVKKTDPRCPQQGFIFTTPKFPGGLCVHEVQEHCCSEFFTGKITSEKILKVKKTDPRCPQQGFIVTTPNHSRLCVHEVAIE